MAVHRASTIGIVLSILVGLAAVLYFFQTKDPMLLILGVVVIGIAWTVAFVVDLVRRGIPVRVVDEKKGER